MCVYVCVCMCVCLCVFVCLCVCVRVCVCVCYNCRLFIGTTLKNALYEFFDTNYVSGRKSILYKLCYGLVSKINEQYCKICEFILPTCQKIIIISFN